MKRIILTVLGVAVLGLTMAACQNNPRQTSAVRAEQKYTNANQGRVSQEIPPPALSHSEERRNLSDRYSRLSDPNKIQYLYLLGLNGNVVGQYTIKGKVSAVSSQITNPQQLICQHFPGNAPDGCGVIDQAEPDGSYGTNGQGHFAFTTTGAYIEFDENYIETDQPMVLHAQPVLSVNANAQVTPTDTSAILNKRRNDRTR